MASSTMTELVQQQLQANEEELRKLSKWSDNLKKAQEEISAGVLQVTQEQIQGLNMASTYKQLKKCKEALLKQRADLEAEIAGVAAVLHELRLQAKAYNKSSAERPKARISCPPQTTATLNSPPSWPSFQKGPPSPIQSPHSSAAKASSVPPRAAQSCFAGDADMLNLATSVRSEVLEQLHLRHSFLGSLPSSKQISGQSQSSRRKTDAPRSSHPGVLQQGLLQQQQQQQQQGSCAGRPAIREPRFSEGGVSWWLNGTKRHEGEQAWAQQAPVARGHCSTSPSPQQSFEQQQQQQQQQPSRAVLAPPITPMAWAGSQDLSGYSVLNGDGLDGLSTGPTSPTAHSQPSACALHADHFRDWQQHWHVLDQLPSPPPSLASEEDHAKSTAASQQQPEASSRNSKHSGAAHRKKKEKHSGGEGAHAAGAHAQEGPSARASSALNPNCSQPSLEAWEVDAGAKQHAESQILGRRSQRHRSQVGGPSDTRDDKGSQGSLQPSILADQAGFSCASASEGVSASDCTDMRANKGFSATASKAAAKNQPHPATPSHQAPLHLSYVDNHNSIAALDPSNTPNTLPYPSASAPHATHASGRSFSTSTSRHAPTGRALHGAVTPSVGDHLSAAPSHQTRIASRPSTNPHSPACGPDAHTSPAPSPSPHPTPSAFACASSGSYSAASPAPSSATPPGPTQNAARSRTDTHKHNKPEWLHPRSSATPHQPHGTPKHGSLASESPSALSSSALLWSQQRVGAPTSGTSASVFTSSPPSMHTAFAPSAPSDAHGAGEGCTAYAEEEEVLHAARARYHHAGSSKSPLSHRHRAGGEPSRCSYDLARPVHEGDQEQPQQQRQQRKMWDSASKVEKEELSRGPLARGTQLDADLGLESESKNHEAKGAANMETLGLRALNRLSKIDAQLQLSKDEVPSSPKNSERLEVEGELYWLRRQVKQLVEALQIEQRKRQEEKRLSRKHKSRLLLSLIRAVGELEAMETETGSTKSEVL